VRQDISWREAMTQALYGAGGFFTRTDRPGGRGGEFRTSVHASPLFASAILNLAVAADEALGHPDPFDIVDIGAGGAVLLQQLGECTPVSLGQRLRLSAVEVAPRPHGLPAHIHWRRQLPAPGTITGLVIATEWLDNVPLDLAETDENGVLRYIMVNPATAAESLGDQLTPQDRAWVRSWWAQRPPHRSSLSFAAGRAAARDCGARSARSSRSRLGLAPLAPRTHRSSLSFAAAGLAPLAPRTHRGVRIELGRPRDEAWASAVAALARGLAVTVDYGHTRQDRPPGGTLAGYRAGRAVPATPDGSCDLTAHVAVDAVRRCGETVAGLPGVLITQREALAALGLDGTRPPLRVADRDPAGYVRALAQASQAAELMDVSGLGGHYWIMQPVATSAAVVPAGLRARHT
jgi:SAM-dependent MidA family methyltransferase